MNIPSAGSPTDTLCQLRPNYHTCAQFHNIKYIIRQNDNYYIEAEGITKNRNNFPHVMGGVCKICYNFHRTILKYDY